MKKIGLLIRWILKSWPVVVPLSIAVIHYIVYLNSSADFTTINEYISLCLQILGCLIVLFNINSNMGTFKENNIPYKLKEYLKSFPLIKRNVTISVNSIASVCVVSGEATVRVKKNGSSITEKIDEMERRIEELWEQISKTKETLRKESYVIKESLERQIFKLNEEMNDIKMTLKDSIIGGLDLQLFGIGLVIYGACISIW